MTLTFRQANQYWPAILGIGLALGIANYSLGLWPNLGQSIVLQIIISVVIGYLSLLVCFNVQDRVTQASPFAKYAGLVLIFVSIGTLGTIVQHLSSMLLFPAQQLQLSSGPFFFNAILSSILGIMFYQWVELRHPNLPDEALSATEDVAEEREEVERLTKIPIRQGESISLFAIEDVIYFEAYDNYSFLHDIHGARLLCSYPLSKLEGRLEDSFLRVHRKYLINQHHIKKVTPHLKGRFVIDFTGMKTQPITSSTSYAEVLKSLTRI